MADQIPQQRLAAAREQQLDAIREEVRKAGPYTKPEIRFLLAELDRTEARAQAERSCPLESEAALSKALGRLERLDYAWTSACGRARGNHTAWQATEQARERLEGDRQIAVHVEQQNAEAHRLLQHAARAGSWETVAQAIRALHGAGLWAHETDPATEPVQPAEDEWLRCSGRRCHNAERAKYAEARGWTRWGMGQWLCPGCAAHGDQTAEQQAGRG